MKRIGLAVALAVSLTLPGYVVAKVSSDVAPGVNFATYQTFAFVNAVPPAGMDPVAYERIRMAVEQGLVSKGFSKSAEGDLTVILSLGAQNKTDIDTWGMFGRQVDVRQYTEGQLSVDVFDTRTRKPLWHGKATDTVGSSLNPEKIDKEVAKLMARFPNRA